MTYVQNFATKKNLSRIITALPEKILSLYLWHPGLGVHETVVEQYNFQIFCLSVQMVTRCNTLIAIWDYEM